MKVGTVTRKEIEGRGSLLASRHLIPPANLAQLKRYLFPGMRIRSTFLARWNRNPDGTARVLILTVKRVGSVDIEFEPQPEVGNNRPMYHRFMKAANYQFTAQGFTLVDGGQSISLYEWIPQTEGASA